MLFLALGWTLRIPADYRGVDEAAGVGNLSQLLGDAFALTTACAILGMLVLQTSASDVGPRRVSVRVAVLAAVLVAMTVSFCIAPLKQETTDFVSRYRGEPGLLAYELPYLGFLSYAFFDLARLCRRYAQLSERRYLKVGMQLIQVAGMLGICYVVLRVAYLVAVQAAPTANLDAYEPLSKLLVAALSILAVVGAVLPAIGPRVSTYRAHRELYPLWAALHEAEPSIALEAPRSRTRDRLRVRDLRFRLHRRVIEIRDGQLALRPYRRRQVAEAARREGRQQQLAGDELEATVEAATLAAAIDAKTQGRQPNANSDAVGVPGGSRIDEEVRWLLRVGRRFKTTSPRRSHRA